MLPYILLVTSILPATYALPQYSQYLTPDSLKFLKTRTGEPTNTTGLTSKHFNWAPPGETDERSPCPFVNTLANHGFINHSGQNITREPWVQGVTEAMNFLPEFADEIFLNGVEKVKGDRNASSFDLSQLHPTHGIIEHDGPLSRADIFFDPSNKFDEVTFSNFMSFFGDAQTFDVPALANARARHALNMSTINPEFAIAQNEVTVIVGENAFLLAVFGDPIGQVANRSFVEFFFRNEQFPVCLGWKPSDVAVGPTIGQIVQDIIAQSPPDVPLTFNSTINSTATTA